jgi:hypothetical protein
MIKRLTRRGGAEGGRGEERKKRKIFHHQEHQEHGGKVWKILELRSVERINEWSPGMPPLEADYPLRIGEG